MRSIVRRAGAVPAILLALSLAAPPPTASAAAGDGDDGPTLPATFVKMWYRTEDERAFKAKRAVGDLTVTTAALDFVGKNETMSIPLDDVRAVALGTMEGDVDNVWTVVELQTGGLLGFRDGRKLGFGSRTEAFYETLRAALRGAGAGPYDVPAGATAYDALDSEFTVAIPAGWSGFHERIVERDDRVLWGTTLFLPLQPDADRERRVVAVARAVAGDAASWRLHREAASAGMDCDGFGDAARSQLVARAAEIGGVAAADVTVGPAEELSGCRALRLTATAAGRGVEILAVSRHGVLFLLAFVEPDADAGEARSAFNLAARTFHVAIAH